MSITLDGKQESERERDEKKEEEEWGSREEMKP